MDKEKEEKTRKQILSLVDALDGPFDEFKKNARELLLRDTTRPAESAPTGREQTCPANFIVLGHDINHKEAQWIAEHLKEWLEKDKRIFRVVEVIPKVGKGWVLRLLRLA